MFVIHGGDQHGRKRIRIQNRSTILAGVHRMLKGLDVHVDIGVATQRGGQRRDFGGPVA